MSEPTRVLAGDCTIVFDGTERTEHRGQVVVLLKPDNTVLVHDAEGYQPVSWLTRADAVSYSRDGAFSVVAHDGDRTLRVTAHTEHGVGRYPASVGGTPVDDCPDCGERLVHASGSVACVGCGAEYGLPAGASVRSATCDCGLPRLRVERGQPFDVCLDRTCESLDDAIAAEFDRRFDCPDCGSDLRVLRRGGLLLGCDAYPDCEVSYGFPDGLVTGECGCGLPTVERSDGHRCLDSSCERGDA